MGYKYSILFRLDSATYFQITRFSEIERNDVVFNYPNELDKPLDLKTYYVKRCVGLPNDTIEIDNGEVRINGGY